MFPGSASVGEKRVELDRPQTGKELPLCSK
jgi:hypothetical protein